MSNIVIASLLFGTLQAYATTQTPTAKISYAANEFTIVRSGKKVVVPTLDKPAETAKYVAFRHDRNYAVWDSRGLTVRVGDRIESFKLGEVAVSPRVSSRDDIRKSLDLFKTGERSKGADALSGAVRLGDDAYFLVRWDDKAGNPWLEALVSVSMNTTKPAWKLVGRFAGASLANKPIDQRLLAYGDQLVALASKSDAWGLAFYSTSLKAFGFKKLGDGRLAMFSPTSSLGGLFAAKSPYGATIYGKLSTSGQAVQVYGEQRGEGHPLDASWPSIWRFKGPMGCTLTNAVTGAVLTIPADAKVKTSPAGVLVWTGAPTKATLYDPSAWTSIAEWKP